MRDKKSRETEREIREVIVEREVSRDSGESLVWPDSKTKIEIGEEGGDGERGLSLR